MPDRSSSDYRISIDRVVVDGAPDDVQPDAFRREVAAEVERLLAEPGAAERLRGGQDRQHVVCKPNGDGASSPVQVARHVVQALQSS